MELVLTRMRSSEHDTIGFLFLNNKFFCYTLDDSEQEVKIPGKTRIPAGRYKVTLRRAGGFYSKYTKRFGEEHPILWIRSVPNFNWIYFHCGNTKEDTSGCILLGDDYRIQPDGSMFLYNSTKTYLRFHKKVKKAIEKIGEKVFVTIVDSDIEDGIT